MLSAHSLETVMKAFREMRGPYQILELQFASFSEISMPTCFNFLNITILAYSKVALISERCV